MRMPSTQNGDNDHEDDDDDALRCTASRDCPTKHIRTVSVSLRLVRWAL